MRTQRLAKRAPLSATARAATPVEPDPAKRSITRSPGFDDVLIMISASLLGFSAAWILPRKSSVTSLHTFVRRRYGLLAGYRTEYPAYPRSLSRSGMLNVLGFSFFPPLTSIAHSSRVKR